MPPVVVPTPLLVPTPRGDAWVHTDLPAGRPGGLLVLGHGAGGGVEAPDLVAVTRAVVAAGWAVARVEQPYLVAGRRSPAPAAALDEAWLAVIERLRADDRPTAAAGAPGAARRTTAGGRTGAGRRAASAGGRASSGVAGVGGVAGVAGVGGVAGVAGVGGVTGVTGLAGLALVVGGRSSGARVACRTATAAGAAAVVALAFPVHAPGRPESTRLDELALPTVPVLVVQGDRDAFGMPPAAPGRTVEVVPGAGHSLRGRAAATAGQLVAAWLGRETGR
jgi:uncharacterized protein